MCLITLAPEPSPRQFRDLACPCLTLIVVHVELVESRELSV